MTATPRRTDELAEDGFPPLLKRFPWYMDVDVMDVPAIVAKLAWPAEGFTQGSSLVIDSNAPAGMRRIWLSEWSKKRLETALVTAQEPDSERWGVEAQIDLADCDHAAVSSQPVLLAFLRAVVPAIGMVPHGEPMVERFGKNRLHGWTATQFIETSSIGAHLDEVWGRAMINVFSCKDFDPDVAVATAVAFFGGVPKRVVVQDRG